ncbi:hypothetical protein [Palleronia abyssalis]|uniref:Uncharacterized protein n=1 Tax=Palleronia abyssalis TaxID=1501240 RepID=A0A2R8BX34_9RHOB|nr:hypothetical protein [Palleronia abyssalis]SPJ24734.1 hypothetical protein PAA8504_02572 [Palleronia abyssalis]
MHHKSVSYAGFAQNPAFQAKVAGVVGRDATKRRATGRRSSLSVWGLPRIVVALWALKIVLVIQMGGTGYTEVIRPLQEGNAVARAVGTILEPDVITLEAARYALIGKDLLRDISYVY